MTPEAISRRTNVPIGEVEKYIRELNQPDLKSRSKLLDGKRIVPLDPNRDWGWRIVNYRHYRNIKDEEARRAYFRGKQREYRKRKARSVKDKGLTKLNGSEQLFSSASASSSVRTKFLEWVSVRKAMGKAPKDWNKMFECQLKWLAKFPDSLQIEILDQSIRNNWQGLFEPKKVGEIRQKQGRNPDELMSDRLWQLKHGNSS
jgi:hypothetical protein